MNAASEPSPSRSSPKGTPAPAPEVLIAVAEVGRELGASSEVSERLARALRVLERRLGAGRSVLFVAGAETRTLSALAAHGLPGEQFRARYGAGVAGRVTATGLPVIVPIVRHDPMALSDLSDVSRWSDSGWNLVAVPVSVAGTCFGALCAYFRHRDSGGFRERLGVLEVVASLVGKTLRASEPGRETPLDRARDPRPADVEFEYANMIGSTPVMRQVYEQVSQVARTNATAFLRGESGTGKELVAKAIHQNSPRAAMPFIKVNCAALPESLFESELFGHERGAFTGAHSRKKGRFELAQGGTLFLDEVGELPITTQAKLLRVLQFREFERLGGTHTLHTDVRIIAATNADMERAVASGTFREDLYYRINIFTVVVPALRERAADIPGLAEYFLAKFAREHGKNVARIGNGALELLVRHAWPGNVRELENVVERAVVICDGPVVQPAHLPESLRDASIQPERPTLAEAVDRLERQMIEESLRAENGNIAAAARALGTTERVIRYKAKHLGLDPASFRQ